MRITPELLHKIARDTVAQRTRSDRDILAVYLHGSLLEDEPLLGGTADIDLFFIHHEKIEGTREIVRLTDEVHLDITHHVRDDYRWARSLRLHPWLGPTMFNCKILFDPQHFLDFTQASVRGQFNQPDNVIGRARGQAEHARQIWYTLHDLTTEPSEVEINLYLRSISYAVNAVASLSGMPLTERRFLVRFPARAEAVRHAGLYPGLQGLLGAPNVDAQVLADWLPQWATAYQAVPRQAVTARLHPDRFYYYQRGINSLINGQQPHNALWPLLRLWTQVAQVLPPEAAPLQDWKEACQQLGIYGTAFRERVAALDAYLDTVEEILDDWAHANGVE
jgi:hypothetical protein